MEFKVRALDSEPKSVQEIEKVLLEKHEQGLSNEAPEIVVEQQSIETPQEQPVDLREEDVLSYIGKRYNKQINSFDELVSERQEVEALPEDSNSSNNSKLEGVRVELHHRKGIVVIKFDVVSKLAKRFAK
jgi:hypothetical protein